MAQQNSMTNQSLSARQIVKIISGQFGSLVEWNDLEAVNGAIDWIVENRNDLKNSMALVKNLVANSKDIEQFKREMTAVAKGGN